MENKKFNPLETNKTNSPYNIRGFSPILLDDYCLRQMGINDISQKAKTALFDGSLKFQRLFRSGNLTSSCEYNVGYLQECSFEIHNYTGKCPTNVIELNPSFGSCSTNCLYCLVSDGDHLNPINVFLNYPKFVEKELVKRKDEKCFFYFSPKTDSLSEPFLETGISHEILRSFIRHYEKYPDSKARLFIASKAGVNHLNFKSKGDSILSLLKSLKGKVQFNGSIGIMPKYLQEVLEPNAASLESRLNAMEILQDNDVYAYSVLAQPIIPCYFNDKSLSNFLDNMKRFGIINIKPEFLTLNMANLAIIAQYVNHFDKDLLKPLLELYVSKENQDHVKQRERIAPNRKYSFDAINLIFNKALERGIGVSICNWVKFQLNLEDNLDFHSKKLGFRCLGYQERLFES